jgi:hypothetical protein
LEVDPVKLICLNDPVNVGVDAPDVRLMFSLFEAVAPETPNVNVLVTDIAALIFDVPVNVKFVAVFIDRTVTPAVVVVRTIEPVLPNAIARVLLPDAENMPVVKVKSFRFNVPFVSVVVRVEPTVIAP